MDPSFHGPLLVIFAAVVIIFVEAAIVVIVWHPLARRRTRRDREASDALGLEFARFLCEGGDPDRMQALARRTSTTAFWAAVEGFADNVQGEQWRVVTALLRDERAVRRARVELAHRSSWHRARAARRLGRLEDPLYRDELLRALRAGPAVVTLSAGLALARLGDEEALEWLLVHPESVEGISRHQLLGLIRRFGSPALGPLRRLAAHEPSPAPLHLAALDALGHFQDVGSRGHLERLARSPQLEQRVASVRALGLMAAVDSLATLTTALRDPAWQVRAQAARALAAFGDAAAPAIPALVARLRDLSWWVRRHSAYALGRTGFRGQAALSVVGEHDADAYARDVAREVLQIIAWEKESPGGVARVE